MNVKLYPTDDHDHTITYTDVLHGLDGMVDRNGTMIRLHDLLYTLTTDYFVDYDHDLGFVLVQLPAKTIEKMTPELVKNMEVFLL